MHKQTCMYICVYTHTYIGVYIYIYEECNVRPHSILSLKRVEASSFLAASIVTSYLFRVQKRSLSF